MLYFVLIKGEMLKTEFECEYIIFIRSFYFNQTEVWNTGKQFNATTLILLQSPIDWLHILATFLLLSFSLRPTYIPTTALCIRVLP